MANDEITVPGVETHSFYFCHCCYHGVKTLGGGYMVGPASMILPNTTLPLINSYNNYNVTPHRALPNTGQAASEGY